MSKLGCIPFGDVRQDTMSTKNYEIHNVLEKNDFAKDGIKLQSHAVFTVPSNLFTSSPNTTTFEKNLKNTSPISGIKIQLFQLFAVVGGLVLKGPDKKDDEESDEPMEETELDGGPPPKPKILYRDTYGELQTEDEELSAFESLSPAEKESFLDDFGYEEKTQEDYNNLWNQYIDDKEAYVALRSKSGSFYVCLEYCPQEHRKEKAAAYRLWILQEEGAEGNISKTFGQLLEFNAQEKLKKMRKRKHDPPKYADNWKEIDNVVEFTQKCGMALFQSKLIFNPDAVKKSKKVLYEREHPCRPEDVFDVRHWLNMTQGLDAETGHERNFIPEFFSDSNIDMEHFRISNYFPDNNLTFQPKAEFRKNMILLERKDLLEGALTNKHRPDLFINAIVQQMNLAKTHERKVVAPPMRQNLTGSFAQDPAFRPRKIRIIPNAECQGQSFKFIEPTVENYSDKKIFKPGDNTFYFQRAISNKQIYPKLNKVTQVGSMEARFSVMIECLEEALKLGQPIFAADSSCNLGDHLLGIVETPNVLAEDNYSYKFINVNNYDSDLHFQDNFMAFVLEVMEFNLYISHLQCQVYKLLINCGSAYRQILDKTHVSQEGDPGTGKSECFNVVKKIKCNGVCKLESSASAKAYAFGPDICFGIIVRHEPDPTRNYGSSNGNHAAQSKTEMEKQMRTEQRLTTKTTVQNKETGKFGIQTESKNISCIILENTNADMDKYEVGRKDRDHQTYIMKTTRPDKSVAQMNSAKSNASEERKRADSMQIYKLQYMDYLFAKINMMQDFVGGLSEVDFTIFDMVTKHWRKFPDLNVKNNRSIERCRNNCRAQVQYDAIMILFMSPPPNKQLLFFLNGKTLSEDLQDRLEDAFKFSKTDVDCVLLKSEHNELFSDDVDDIELEGLQEVNCCINLLNNVVYIVDEDGNREKTQALFEHKWMHDLYTSMLPWHEDREFEQGEKCFIHVTGKDANYASYLKSFVCLKTNQNEHPESSDCWQEESYEVESLLGKYYQETLEFEGERAIEQWCDINRLLYSTVDTSIRTYALMRDEFMREHDHKVRNEIVRLGISQMKNISLDKPWQSFKKDVFTDARAELAEDNVDLNYVFIGTKNSLMGIIKENLKNSLKKGMPTIPNDNVIRKCIRQLEEYYADSYYPEFAKSTETSYGSSPQRLYPHFQKDSDVWQLPFKEDAQVNKRNSELKASGAAVTKRKVIERVNEKFYILVSFMDDFMQLQNSQSEELYRGDQYLNALSKFKYFSPEKESKKILIAQDWSGMIVNKKNKEERYVNPSLSSYLTIEGDPSEKQSIREENTIDDYSARNLSLRISTKRRNEKVNIHLDDFAMKKHLKKLHMLPDFKDDEEEKEYIEKHLKVYSKNQLKKQLNETKPPPKERYPQGVAQVKWARSKE